MQEILPHLYLLFRKIMNDVLNVMDRGNMNIQMKLLDDR